MVARCVFSLPIGTANEQLGIPIGLESYSPYLIIIGTELGALLGYDTRIATKEVFKYNCDLKCGKIKGFLRIFPKKKLLSAINNTLTNFKIVI